MTRRECSWAALAAVVTLFVSLCSPAQSFLLTPRTATTISSVAASSPLTLTRMAASDGDAKKFKGFGEAPKKPEPKPKSKAQLEREKYASAYDEMAQKGVPEYVVYIREKGGEDKDWKFVGALAVPRTLKVDDVIYENEESLVKGAMKMYPQMKKVSPDSLEYGSNLKKFPDEPIKVAVKGSGSGDKNPVVGWIENVISPLDPSGMGKK